jgi:hypothetical protein
MSDSPNGSKPPPESLHFERSGVQCRKCGRVFKGLIFEEIDGLSQIRLDDGLVELLKLRCLHCGEVFNWSPTEKVLKQMAADYHELVALIGKRYSAE